VLVSRPFFLAFPFASPRFFLNFSRFRDLQRHMSRSHFIYLDLHCQPLFAGRLVSCFSRTSSLPALDVFRFSFLVSADFVLGQTFPFFFCAPSPPHVCRDALATCDFGSQLFARFSRLALLLCLTSLFYNYPRGGYCPLPLSIRTDERIAPVFLRSPFPLLFDCCPVQ